MFKTYIHVPTDRHRHRYRSRGPVPAPVPVRPHEPTLATGTDRFPRQHIRKRYENDVNARFEHQSRRRAHEISITELAGSSWPRDAACDDHVDDQVARTQPRDRAHGRVVGQIGAAAHWDGHGASRERRLGLANGRVSWKRSSQDDETDRAVETRMKRLRSEQAHSAAYSLRRCSHAFFLSTSKRVQ